MATYQKLKASFDEDNGGFGDAPKFPKPGGFSSLSSSLRLDEVTKCN